MNWRLRAASAGKYALFGNADSPRELVSSPQGIALVSAATAVPHLVSCIEYRRFAALRTPAAVAQWKYGISTCPHGVAVSPLFLPSDRPLGQ